MTNVADIAHARTDEADLSRAYRACRDVARARGRNFYYGLRLTPEPKRSALFAIYAWMRRADDIVDAVAADGSEARAALEDFLDHTNHVFANGQQPSSGIHINGDPMWLAFADTIARFRLRRVEFNSMIDGQLADLDHRQPQTFDDLYRYCRQVAATVGQVCISIWGFEHEEARQLAEWRGIAFQLTNILRDCAEDHDSRRVYLPREDFERFDLDPEQFRRWAEPSKCAEFIRFQAARAREYYDRSAPLERLIDSEGTAALWAMTEIYRRLLDQVDAEPQRVILGPRIAVPSSQKAWIALTASWKGRRRK